MNARRQIETQFLVLRLTPYSDTSLIVAGLTPEWGQVHFVVRGAKRLGPKHFPLLDLFRVLQVSYRDTGAELLRLGGADLVADHSGVARHLTTFQTAGWLAHFALANAPAGLGQQALLEALCVGLVRLASLAPADDAVAVADAVVVGVLLAYLQEGGWLAEQDRDERAAQQCQCLLAMAAGQAPPPRLTAANWHELRRWAVGLALAAECQMPDEPPSR
jgi:recombinational DNA repair protein (RecF pathway)